MTAAQSQFAPSVAFAPITNPFKDEPRGVPSGSTSTFSAVSGPAHARNQSHGSLSQLSALTPQPAEIGAMEVEARTKEALRQK